MQKYHVTLLLYIINDVEVDLDDDANHFVSHLNFFTFLINFPDFLNNQKNTL